MKIFIGADHNGFRLKEHIEAYLRKLGHEVKDVSGNKLDPHDDFPIHSAKVANSVLITPDSFGILLCGSGQGVCMAANRYKGIRASLVWNQNEARLSRSDDDANILCIPAREFKSLDSVKSIIDLWLDTPFDGAARYVRRIKQVDELN